MGGCGDVKGALSCYGGQQVFRSHAQQQSDQGRRFGQGTVDVGCSKIETGAELQVMRVVAYQEMRDQGCDGLANVILPSRGLDVSHAATGTGYGGAGSDVAGTAGAQIGHGDVDRPGQAQAGIGDGDLDHGGQLQQSGGGPAVQGWKDRVTDQPVSERHNQDRTVVVALGAKAEKAGIGQGGQDLFGGHDARSPVSI